MITCLSVVCVFSIVSDPLSLRTELFFNSRGPSFNHFRFLPPLDHHWSLSTHIVFHDHWSPYYFPMATNPTSMITDLIAIVIEYLLKILGHHSWKKSSMVIYIFSRYVYWSSGNWCRSPCCEYRYCLFSLVIEHFLRSLTFWYQFKDLSWIIDLHSAITWLFSMIIEHFLRSLIFRCPLIYWKPIFSDNQCIVWGYKSSSDDQLPFLAVTNLLLSYGDPYEGSPSGGGILLYHRIDISWTFFQS